MITPLIAAIIGKPDFSAIVFTVNNSKFLIGDFVNAIVSFILIGAAVYFFIVLPVNNLLARMRRQSTRHNLWTKITRPKYERAAQRYASDLTDAGRAVHRTPYASDQASGAAARDRFARGPRRHSLYRADRLSVAHVAQGLSAVHHAAKKVKGRKRHIVTDTTGLMVGAAVHPADVQDRDGALLVIETIHDLFPWLRHLFADSAYSGDKILKTLPKFGRWSIEIVKRMADTVGFEVLPRRWVVERTLAWLNRNRRLAKDFEASIESAKAWVYVASLQLLIRRLVRP